MVRYLLRRPEVLQRLGRSSTALDNDIKAGVVTPQVDYGPRMKAWPSDEIEAIIDARVAGKSDEEVRKLVRHLVAARKDAVA